MRAIVLGAVALMLASCDESKRTVPAASTSTAAPPAVALPISLQTPSVPPLLPGEKPPEGAPNYFDAKELGGGAVATYFACVGQVTDADADIIPDALVTTCMCVADGARQSARKGSILSDSQIHTCFQASGPSPYAAGLKISTAQVIDAFERCVEVLRPDSPDGYPVRACLCDIDAYVKHGGSLPDGDVSRCDVAARYSTNTGINLTPRQFALLAPGTLAPATPLPNSGPVVAVPAATPRVFFPGAGSVPADFGDISKVTGLPRTQYVQGYQRRDGTYVAPYFRSHR